MTKKETDPLISTSSSQIDIKTIKKNVGKAAFLIRDVIMDDWTVATNWTYNPYDQENSKLSNKVSMFCRVILSNDWVGSLIHLVSWALVLLTFVEDPGWCRNLDGGCDKILNMRGVPAFGEDYEVDVEYYPNVNTNWLDPYQSYYVELTCAIMLLLYVLLLIGRDGLSTSNFLRTSRGLNGYKLVLVISVFCLNIGLIGQVVFSWTRPLSLYIRLIILITFKDSIQRELKYVARVIPEIANTLFILLLIVVFYAWIGNAAFYGSREGIAHFSSLVEGMFTLWTCVTTSNYPDVMMLGYNENRVITLYFISFMVIAFYFVMNVILASVVNSYNSSETTYEEEKAKDIKKNLNDAYELLDQDNHGWIGKKSIMEIFHILNEECPEIRHINKEKAEILFAILDRDGDESISRKEFMYFTRCMLLEFKRYNLKGTIMEVYFPKIYASDGFQGFKKFITSKLFDNVIDIIIFLNAIIVFIQSFPELSGEVAVQDPHIKDGELDTVWEIAETIFTVLYCLEMCSKLLVLGWERYTKESRNIFDAFVTILALASTIYVYYPNQFSNSLLIRYVVMARVLRLVRVLTALPQFQTIGRIFVDLAPAASRVFLLLMVIMYVFAAIGMQSFGGLVTRDPENPISYRLENNTFADNVYWSNSFNDMLSGMNVLFNLLVVNNWPEEADGILAVSGTRLSRYFFVAFHIFGVVIVNNIVVAYVVDAFMCEIENSSGKEKEENIRDLDTDILDASDAILSDANNAIFDASQISGTKTTLKGHFIVRMRAAGKKKAKREALFKSLFNVDSIADA